MPPKSDNFDQFLEPEPLLEHGEGVDADTETSGEAYLAFEDLQTFASKTVDALNDSAASIPVEGERLVEDIPASLNSSPEEVREATEETGLLSKLRSIGDRALDTVADASDKIDKVIKMAYKGAGLFSAGAAIGIGALAPSSEVEPPKPPKAEAASEERINYWYRDDVFIDSLETIQNFERTYRVKPKEGDPVVVVDSGKLNAAIGLLEKKIADYPPELRKDIIKDNNIVVVIDGLNDLAALQGDRPHSTEEMLLAGDAKERAMHAAINSVMRIHTDIIEGAAMQLEKGDRSGVDTAARLFSAHIDNVTEYADVTDEPQISTSIPGALGSVEAISQKVLTRLSPGYERYRSPQKTALLGFLAKAGNKEGIEILAEKVAKGKLDLNAIPGLFNDKPRPDRALTLQSLNEAELGVENLNRGGEFVAGALLKRYGLDPVEYMKYWQQQKDSLVEAKSFREREGLIMNYNYRIEHNIKNVIELEKVPGSTEKLAHDFGIRFPGRYPIEQLREQLNEKDVIPQNYGMAITTRQDWNGAFDPQKHMANLFLEAKKVGGTLRVAEAEDAQEAMQRPLDFVDKYKGKKADFIQIGGHGEKTNIAMGKGEAGLIDARVFGVWPATTSLVLQDGATVVLDACSTGDPGPDGFARTLSGYTSGKVIGPNIPAYIKSMKLSRDEKSGVVAVDVSYGTNDHPDAIETKTYQGGKELSARPPASPPPLQKGNNTGGTGGFIPR